MRMDKFKKNGLTIVPAVFCMAAWFSSANADAATLKGEPSTASADITFVAPVKFTHTIQPVSGLTSGEITSETQVAKGEINFSSGATSKVALYFQGPTPSPVSGKRIMYSLSGKSNSQNRMAVLIDNIGTNEAQGTIPKRFTLLPVTDNKATYTVVTSSGQTVAPDTYELTLVAQAYEP